MGPETTGAPDPLPTAESASPTPAASTAASDAATGPDQAPASGAPAAPDDAANDGRFSRRRLLRWFTGLAIFSTAALIVTPIIGFLIPQKSSQAATGGKVAVAKVADIPPGAGKVVPMGSTPAVVVSTEQGVRAYSAICTHLGCVVAWNDLAGVIQCPCHDGRFNPVSGAVVSGPPPAPLPPIEVAIEGDDIFLIEG